MNINEKTKGIIKIIIGIVMAVTAIIGYAPLPHEYWVEFTGISNFTGGVLLIVDGIMNLKEKKLPGILHLNVCVGVVFVFLVCLASLTFSPFNFAGAFFFLHVLNPIAFALIYIFLCRDDADSTLKHILAAPVFAAAYFVFDYILGNCRGHFVYGFFTPEILSILMAVLIEAAVFLVLMGMGLLLFKLNQKAHKD